MHAACRSWMHPCPMDAFTTFISGQSVPCGHPLASKLCSVSTPRSPTGCWHCCCPQASYASDVYAFATMLWELYIGHEAFQGLSAWQVGTQGRQCMAAECPAH
jgi:hypothetical protein